MRRFALVVLVAVVWAFCPAAWGAAAPKVSAEQLTAARALADAGAQLFDQKDFATAYERFRAAEDIVHAPPHLLFMAKAELALGKLVEARELFQKLADEHLGARAPEPFREAQAEAVSSVKDLRTRIPSLRIEVKGPGAGKARVTVDGHDVADSALAAPLPLNPGSHVVVARAEGQPDAAATVHLKERAGTSSVVLTVRAASGTSPTVETTKASASSTQEGATVEAATPESAAPTRADADQGPSLVGPLAVMGAGVAFLGVGIITGVLTLNDAADLKGRCPTNPCSPDNQSLADSVNTLGAVSTVGFVVGTAAVGAGLLWLLLEPASDPAATEPAAKAAEVSVQIGAGSLAIGGRF